jgi:hypothetical protein
MLRATRSIDRMLEGPQSTVAQRLLRDILVADYHVFVAECQSRDYPFPTLRTMIERERRVRAVVRSFELSEVASMLSCLTLTAQAFQQRAQVRDGHSDSRHTGINHSPNDATEP